MTKLSSRMDMALRILADSGPSAMLWASPRTRGALFWHGLTAREGMTGPYHITGLGRMALRTGRFESR